MKAEYGTSDFLRLMSAAYDKFFTRKNVLKRFAAAGICLFYPTAVLIVPHPLSEEPIEKVFRRGQSGRAFRAQRKGESGWNLYSTSHCESWLCRYLERSDVNKD